MDTIIKKNIEELNRLAKENSRPGLNVYPYVEEGQEDSDELCVYGLTVNCYPVADNTDPECIEYAINAATAGYDAAMKQTAMEHSSIQG